MRVEVGDHASDGVIDEFFLIHRFDVVALDHAEDGGQLLQLFQGQRGHVGARHSLQRERGERTSECANGQPTCNFQFLAHGYLVRNNTAAPAGDLGR